MSEVYEMKVIARIHNDFPTKFGIPHQSNRLETLKATIVFEPEYRVTEAFRGLEEYSYIWLIWQFSEAVRDTWSPTVRPPRLGGNTRMGVFATRSPFRPNNLGLSSVKLEKIEFDQELGPILHISGADLMAEILWMEHRFLISNHIFLMQTVIRMQREDLRIISEIIGYRWNFRKN